MQKINIIKYEIKSKKKASQQYGGRLLFTQSPIYRRYAKSHLERGFDA